MKCPQSYREPLLLPSVFAGEYNAGKVHVQIDLDGEWLHWCGWCGFAGMLDQFDCMGACEPGNLFCPECNGQSADYGQRHECGECSDELKKPDPGMLF